VRVEYTILVPLVAAILFLGLFPKPVLDRVNVESCASVVHVAATGSRSFSVPAGCESFEKAGGGGGTG
jgi:NADH:ubiquinone oxidoreductase subunit 4 (subunit M)